MHFDSVHDFCHIRPVLAIAVVKKKLYVSSRKKKFIHTDIQFVRFYPGDKPQLCLAEFIRISKRNNM